MTRKSGFFTQQNKLINSEKNIIRILYFCIFQYPGNGKVMQHIIILVFLILLFLTGLAFPQVDFTWHTIDTDLLWPRSPAAADLDGDGDIDIVCTGRNEPVYWWENDGSYPPQFDRQESLTDNFIISSEVKTIDIDFDGDIDIIATGKVDEATDIAKLWVNDGGNPPEFVVQDFDAFDDLLDPLGVGDLDNDGDLDICFSGIWREGFESYDKILIYENNEELFDTLTVPIDLDNTLNDMSLVFLDDDEYIDIIFCAGWDGILWLKNLGDMNFSEQIVIGDDEHCKSFQPCDLDSDGDLDFVGCSSSVGDDLYWYENNGNEEPEFTYHYLAFSGNPQAVYTSDLDLDNDIDVLNASGDPEGFYGHLKYFLNDGMQNVTEYVISDEFYGPYGPNTMTAIDLDFDGDQDIIATAAWYPVLAWFENHTIDAEIEPFHLESPEPGFTTPDTQVVLVWNWAIPNFETDITYHIKCHDHPDNDEIIAETADTTYIFTGIPGTQYFWDVKAAADNGLEQWAEEHFWHFTIVDTTNSVDDPIASSFPTEYEIQSVYPNPFNASTTITVALPQPSHLSLQIFNTTGQKVSSLAEGQYNQGYQNFVFNGSGLSSGIYFIRLEVAREQRFPGNLNEIQKILLIK